MEFKGTKGKWEYKVKHTKKRGLIGVYITEEHFIEISYISEDECPSPVCCNYEQHANALLISKAPELLEALKEANNVLKMASLIDKSNVCEDTQLMCEKLIKETTNVK